MTIPNGTRIRLIRMPDEADPIPSGTTGTVTSCTEFPDWTQIGVRWDNTGRALMLCVPPDKFEVIS